MAKVSIGSITSFNHEVQDWSIYKDRLEQWFLANSLEDTEDKSKVKRRAVLLSSLCENTYKLVRDLALPADVTSLNYDAVVKLLDDHLKTVKCGFAERFKFHSASQQVNEGISEWAARVRGLAAHCGFSAAVLNENLRDRFILGMQPGAERDKLFTQSLGELTLSKALELAEAIKCARQGASQAITHGLNPSSQEHVTLPVLRMAASSSPRASEPARRDNVCPACGYKGHEASTCKFTKYRCKTCGQRGHLRRMCQKTNAKHNFIECCPEGEDMSDDEESDDDAKTLKNRKLWSRWSKWGVCSVTCGSGFMARQRACVAGLCACGEREEQRRPCRRTPCPTHMNEPE